MYFSELYSSLIVKGRDRKGLRVIGLGGKDYSVTPIILSNSVAASRGPLDS